MRVRKDEKMPGSEKTEHIQVENKLILLYIINKMELPLSRSQLTEFVREGEYMDYYIMQETLAEMSDEGYLESSQDNNNTRYSITDEGITMLDYFENLIPPSVRAKITQYVQQRFNCIKRDFEVTANYFLDSDTNEYIVKCGAYEDKCLLMEVQVSVVSRAQAKLISSNWKNHASETYLNILNELIRKREKPEAVTA
jgi:DNA-binding PadR family transcriptional regulator